MTALQEAKAEILLLLAQGNGMGGERHGMSSRDDSDNDVPASDAECSDGGTQSTYEDAAAQDAQYGNAQPGAPHGHCRGGAGSAKRGRDDHHDVPVEGARSVHLAASSPQLASRKHSMNKVYLCNMAVTGVAVTGGASQLLPRRAVLTDCARSAQAAEAVLDASRCLAPPGAPPVSGPREERPSLPQPQHSRNAVHMRGVPHAAPCMPPHPQDCARRL